MVHNMHRGGSKLTSQILGGGDREIIPFLPPSGERIRLEEQEVHLPHFSAGVRGKFGAPKIKSPSSGKGRGWRAS